MPPASSPPPRPSDNLRPSGGPYSPAQGRAGLRPSQYQPTKDESIAGSLSVNLADFFAEALDSAIALVRADGGELATLDGTGQTLVLRARAKRPRLGGLGTGTRSSQPLHPALLGASSGSSAGGMLADLAGVHDSLDDYGIESQTTILLPAAAGSRQYRRGEGLIGQVWQQGEPRVLSGEEFRAQPHASSSSGVDAPWHLAVPIFRPGSLNAVPDPTAVIGVLAVYNRDPLWAFSKMHVELLTLHADRVARAMRTAELARQNESRGELLEVLRAIDGRQPDLLELYSRVRDIIRHLVDAPSFAVAISERPTAFQRKPNHPDHLVTFEYAERDGQLVEAEKRYSSQMPAWWQAVRSERLVCVSTREERTSHPELIHLGFGSEQPVQSVLAVQLVGGGSPLGAIVVGSPTPDAYTPEHARLFEAAAHAAAIVIENVLLAQDRERSRKVAEDQATSLAVLNNAVLTLNSSLDVDETIRAVAAQATKVTSATNCAIFLCAPMERELIWRAPNDAPPPTGPHGHEARIPLDWHNLDLAMESQQFLLLDQLESEWHEETSLGRWLAANEIHSCLVMPMDRPTRAQETPAELDERQPRNPHLGMLMVYSSDWHKHLTPIEVGLLQGLASQAAIAISNAQLYEDLKTLDRLKDDFILTVSHEFRTPLTTIDGYVSLIGRHAEKLDKERLEQYGREIRMATGQLASMISTLVDVNRMDTEPLTVESVPVNVRPTVARVIATLPHEAQERVRFEVSEQLWVSADGERLPTVFSNLISNALKYGSATTPCKVTATLVAPDVLRQQGRKVPIGPGSPAQWAVLGVRDFGIGIEETDHHKLFQKFVRLPRSLTTAVRGTGLGLWICKQYVTAMGGDIWVESAYGQGSHFQFCLPVATPPTGA